MKDFLLNKLSIINDKLIDEMNNDKNQQQYRYLLLDRLGNVSELSLIDNEALQETVSPERLAVIKRPDLDHELLSCPLLLCLGKPNQPIDQQRLSAAVIQIKNEYLTKKQYVCGFISSPLPPEELADSLLESCLRAGKALGKKFFPFYEPFTLDILRHSYPEPASHLGLLLPADSSYYLIDTDGELYIFHSVSYQDDWDFVLRFTNESIHYNQLNQFALYQIVVTLYDLYQQKSKPLPTNVLSNIIHYFYDPKAMHLSNPNDRRVYVLFCLIYGPLTSSEWLSNIIDKVIANDEMQGQLGNLLSQEKQTLNTLIKSNK
jgi:hypothetical protein